MADSDARVRGSINGRYCWLGLGWWYTDKVYWCGGFYGHSCRMVIEKPNHAQPQWIVFIASDKYLFHSEYTHGGWRRRKIRYTKWIGLEHLSASQLLDGFLKLGSVGTNNFVELLAVQVESKSGHGTDTNFSSDILFKYHILLSEPVPHPSSLFFFFQWYTYSNIIDINLCVSNVSVFSSDFLELGSNQLAGTFSRVAWHMNIHSCQETPNMFIDLPHQVAWKSIAT